MDIPRRRSRRVSSAGASGGYFEVALRPVTAGADEVRHRVGLRAGEAVERKINTERSTSVDTQLIPSLRVSRRACHHVSTAT